MPSSTNEDKIRELEKLVATINERVDTVRNELIDREKFAVLEERVAELRKAADGSTPKLAVLEDRVAELKKSADNWGAGWRSLLVAFVSAVVGAVLTILAGLVLQHLKAPPGP